MSTPPTIREELLFPTPLYSAEIQDAAALNKKLCSAISILAAESAGISRSNRNGWHSETDIFARREPAFVELGRQLVAGVRSVLHHNSRGSQQKDLGMRMQGWVNINQKGAYNAPHDHPGYQFSGCYYVQVPESERPSSGNIEFLDHRTNLGSFGLLGGHYRTKYSRRPKAGEFLIFPAYLRHWVHPNEEDEDRISVAFNVRLVLPEGTR